MRARTRCLWPGVPFPPVWDCRWVLLPCDSRRKNTDVSASDSVATRITGPPVILYANAERHLVLRRSAWSDARS